MKNLIFITLFVFGLVAVSCDRDIEFPTVSVTDPALQVQVEGPVNNNTYPKIEGVTVTLYSSDNTLLATGTTDSEGHVTFAKGKLKEEGIFTVTATKGSLSKTATTPYLLLNDGVTLFIIQLQ